MKVRYQWFVMTDGGTLARPREMMPHNGNFLCDINDLYVDGKCGYDTQDEAREALTLWFEDYDMFGSDDYILVEICTRN